MAMSDILLSSFLGDPQIVNGDFVVGSSDPQSIAILLKSAPGAFKQFPLIGAALPADLSGSYSPQDIKSQITVAMRGDNYKNIMVNILNGQIQVSGNH